MEHCANLLSGEKIINIMEEEVTVSQESEFNIRHIEEILNNLEYGSINISVSDGKITQIDTKNNDRPYSVAEKSRA